MLRGAGVLMHISSLPGKFGIGTLGKEAYEFVDFIKKSSLKYWQILPLGHTGFGDSPYQCIDAFAGNPYFIDFDELKKDGLLNEGDYCYLNYGDDSERIDYGKLYTEKYKVLRKAYENFKCKEVNNLNNMFEEFKQENSFWLEDYSLYMALKLKFNVGSWYNWDDDIKKRKKETIKAYTKQLANEIEYWNFIQFIFFKQWKELKHYANSSGIKIIGDIPIYVAQDSVDTWANSENFKIDEDTMNPKLVSGCPPDSLSPTGQLWGNPIYDWDYMKKNRYKWWISRISENLKLYDIVRIDHFRGFESYWAIPYGENTASNGHWEKGPGLDLFNEVKKQLGEVDIIAEDLGYLTDEIIKFLKDTGFPGMRVLEFAFNGTNDNHYLPHNYDKECVAYTGTHDNDTLVGWLDHSSLDYEKNNAKLYLGLNAEEGYNWGMIRGVWSSIANVAIAPIQDLLGLGNEARMNLPSSSGGNWSWRMKANSLNNQLARKISDMCYRYRRN